MINRAEVFFGSMLDEDDELDKIRKEAEDENIPIIRQSCEFFLKWVCATLSPEKILEIGTAVGYSGMRMLSFSCDVTTLTTIELSDKMYDRAEANFKHYGFSNRVNLIKGDGCKVLPTLDGHFDLIFLDAAKGQYINMLDDCKRLLRNGGVLVADNILHDRDILESRYTLRRRDRTIHTRMREFLYELSRDEDFVVDFLSDGDGIAVVTKVENDG